MWSHVVASVAAVAVVASASDVRAVVEGAVRFGALFAVHGAPAAASGECGAVREHYGIQRVEATLLALDAINADASLLAGVPLGAELRDSCWAPPTALRQTMDLVRDAITPAHRGRPPPHVPASCTEEKEGGGGGGGGPLVGVLGPGASAAAVQVQNLLQLFAIPQVSYSATARELSDRARFSTFFRVVPSDRHQARLLVALLRAHNWTYVHAIHTDESYGVSGMAAFREEASRGGVCVAREVGLRAAPSVREVDAALRRLAGGPRVAVCWCEGRTARALLQGVARSTEAGVPTLRLVASDGWADRRDVVAGLERAARGSLTLRIRSPYLKHFDLHYHALTPDNNTRNPWFREFWEQKFNCTLSQNMSSEMKRCTGRESLSRDYTQEPKLALVVRGVYALAHALHAMRVATCGAAAPARGLCADMLPFNVTRYREHLARVRFRAPDGGLVAFDDNGDPPPELSEYDVMTFSGSRGGGYARVGRWRRGVLRLRGGARGAWRRARVVRAVCSAPCGVGEWARAGEGRARCCWTCVRCPPRAVVSPPPALGCRLCPPGYRPDSHRTKCLPSIVEWGGGESGGGRWARWTAGGAACAGLSVGATCAAVFWRHRTTPVVKSASRELCALLLCAAALCHCAALAAVTRPSSLACSVIRLGPPALSGVYAAVVVRVARLVAAAERRPGARPRLLSSRAQVSTWCALSGPGVATAVWAVQRWPPAVRVLHPGDGARAVLACSGESATAQLAPLAPALALLGACVALSVRTRRLPHNLNETRWVGAAAYATGVTWLAFFPLYAVSEARSATLCACVSLSAGACVSLALGPRLWVCACRPHRNTRVHFLTATSIRCHLGKYRPGEASRDMSPPSLTTTDKREVGCQTARSVEARCEDEGEGERCARAGVCARVTRTSLLGHEADDDVLILLMHHRHVLPAAHLDNANHNDQ